MKSSRHKSKSLPRSGRHSRRRRKEPRITALKEHVEALPKPEWIKIGVDDVVKEVV